MRRRDKRYCEKKTGGKTTERKLPERTATAEDRRDWHTNPSPVVPKYNYCKMVGSELTGILENGTTTHNHVICPLKFHSSKENAMSENQRTNAVSQLKVI